MAITVRKILTLDYKSVKFAVEGITNYRYTEIYIPQQDEWVGLSDAEDWGYIESIETEFDDYTGSDHIQVTFDTATIEEGYPVWQFRISNYDGAVGSGGEPTETVYYYAAVRFQYDGASTKETGEPVDITVRDMFLIDRYAYLWTYYMLGYEPDFNWFDGLGTGDEIYYYYLENPAYNLMEIVGFNTSSSYIDVMEEKLENILNNVYQGADFKAEYFNDIKYVINNFYVDV
jgi:hypothetical protein